MEILHLDIETFSSVDIKTSGAYKYVESIDFEILLLAYAFDDEEIRILDFAQGDLWPERLAKALISPNVLKCAHNATFERVALRAIGIDIPVDQWYCTAIKASYCGLPLSLENVSKALDLKEFGKSATGKALIKYFCMPCKPTKINGGRKRNFPRHDPDKWEEFKEYCVQDVVAEREIELKLAHTSIPVTERKMYFLDQDINDRGIEIDTALAEKAIEFDGINSQLLKAEMKELTGVDNPNSPAQLKKWLSDKLGKDIQSLAKDTLPDLIADAGEGSDAARVVALRGKLAKSSIKKYTSMINCCCDDGRGHGFFQFYGASTGRWAGRLVQLQNLPQNHLKYLDEDRQGLVNLNYADYADLLDDMEREEHNELASTLSQLIRTALVAKKGNTFCVADYSAIEARVIAWLAGEEWRMEVFRTTGKIYEASAAAMFHVPVEEVTKGSDYRAKGKIAELALGYQGAIGALRTMGGEKMGLSDQEMTSIVERWRRASPAIVQFWKDVEGLAKKAIRVKRPFVSEHKGLIFDCDNEALTIQLPSGRKLFYREPSFTLNRFGQESIKYKTLVAETRKWDYTETYGGKLTENIVQAVARDLLVESMIALNYHNFKITMHVHDEAVCEVPLDKAEKGLTDMCNIMGEGALWSAGLPLNADGYITPYYKKD